MKIIIKKCIFIPRSLWGKSPSNHIFVANGLGFVPVGSIPTDNLPRRQKVSIHVFSLKSKFIPKKTGTL